MRHVVLVLRDLREVGLTASKEHRTFQNERVNSDWRPAEGIFITLRGPEPVNSLIKCFLRRLFEGCTTHIKTPNHSAQDLNVSREVDNHFKADNL